MEALKPLVSIMIPTFNRVDRLKRAIESALRQDYAQVEVIVSDNASEDATDAYLRSIGGQGVRVYRQEKNIGLIANWNFLIKKAEGDYCLMLSDDDELCDDAIGNLLAGFISGSQSAIDDEISVVIGRASFLGEQVYQSRTPPTTLGRDEFVRRILENEVQGLPSATLLKTSLVKKAGYRAYYKTAIDLGLLIDITEKNSVTVIDRVVCKYNVHADNITSKFDIDDVYKTYRRLLRTAFGRSAYLNDQHAFMRKMLGYVVSERYAWQKISMLAALGYQKKYHRYFRLNDYASISFKMIAKRAYYKIKRVTHE